MDELQVVFGIILKPFRHRSNTISIKTTLGDNIGSYKSPLPNFCQNLGDLFYASLHKLRCQLAILAAARQKLSKQDRFCYRENFTRCSKTRQASLGVTSNARNIKTGTAFKPLHCYSNYLGFTSRVAKFDAFYSVL